MIISEILIALGASLLVYRFGNMDPTSAATGRRLLKSFRGLDTIVFQHEAQIEQVFPMIQLGRKLVRQAPIHHKMLLIVTQEAVRQG
jgi:hypothetical protein